MLILGTVKDIGDMDVTVALPNQLKGYVNITDVSSFLTAKLEAMAESDDESNQDQDVPSLSELFEIGQMILVSVASSEKKIELSTTPSTLNASLKTLVKGSVLQCEIISEEEYGYIVSFGLLNGFLPKSECSKELKEGSVHLVRILDDKGKCSMDISQTVSLPCQIFVYITI